MKNVKDLMKFIKRIKFASTMFDNYNDFYSFVMDEKRFNYSRVMVKSDFQRLVSITGKNLY